MILYFDSGANVVAVVVADTGDTGHDVFVETGMDFGLLEKLNNGVVMVVIVAVSFYTKICISIFIL